MDTLRSSSRVSARPCREWSIVVIASLFIGVLSSCGKPTPDSTRVNKVDSSDSARKTPQREGVASATAMHETCEVRLSRLVNGNRAPVIVGKEPLKAPVFPVTYDWEEDKRVLSEVEKLCREVHDMWECLVRHSNDKQYCIILENEESASFYTVGVICSRLTSRAVASVVITGDPQVDRRRLGFTVSGKRYGEWFQQRCNEGASLITMQSELCTAVMHGIDEDTSLTPEERADQIASIKSTIDTLQSGRKMPVLKSLWDRNSHRAFTKESSERSLRRVRDAGLDDVIDRQSP
jgi:hypothetical protein